MGWINRAAIVASAMTSAYLGASAALALRMSRRSRRMPLHDDPSSVGLPFMEVSFNSRRDLADPEHLLKGWLVLPKGVEVTPVARDTRWLVIVHGDGANRADPQAGAMGLAKAMWESGYGVLMFDLRGCGESDDGDFTGGWTERLDVLGALDHLVWLGADRSRIGVLGFSLGGVAATLACSNPGVAGAVISDSAFSDLWSIVKVRTGMRDAVAELVRPGLDLMLQMLVGYRLGEVSPEQHVSECDTPVLVIHGARDNLVPVTHARRLARARGLSQSEIDGGDCEELWIAPEAGHAQAFRTYPVEYVDRVAAFLDRHLAR